jgi:hypothetical protein
MSLDRTFQIYATAPKHNITNSHHYTTQHNIPLTRLQVFFCTLQLSETWRLPIYRIRRDVRYNACHTICSATCASPCHLYDPTLSHWALPATVIHRNATCGSTILSLLNDNELAPSLEIVRKGVIGNERVFNLIERLYFTINTWIVKLINPF